MGSRPFLRTSEVGTFEHCDELLSKPNALDCPVKYLASYGERAIKDALKADNFDLLMFIVSHGIGFEYLEDHLIKGEKESDSTGPVEESSEYPGLLVSGRCALRFS